MNATGTLAIGELAEASGVSVSAIRYYEKRGLVQPAARVGGKRRFDRGTVGRVNFVRRAREAGFALDDVRRILDDRSGEWPDIVSHHLDDLRRHRNELDVMITMVDEMRRCGCEVVAQCPRVST